MTKSRKIAGAACIAALLAMQCSANAADTDAGRAYAERMCTECHAISAGAQALGKMNAPSFQAIADERTTSAIGLNVFLVTPHRNMPNLIIPDEDRRNVIAYILSLKGGRREKSSRLFGQ